MDLRGGISKGFTIVELLIVIVVVGILAAIVIVAYNGIQTKAQTNAIYNEMTEWQKLFVAYKSINGSYPDPSGNGSYATAGGDGTSAMNRYCLGTGFPGGYCLANSSNTAWRVTESKNATLMSQLATIGSFPANSQKYTYAGLVGPVVTYGSLNSISIWGVFPAGTTCPSGTTSLDGGSWMYCYMTLN